MALLAAAPSAIAQEQTESIDSLLTRVAPEVRENLNSTSPKARTLTSPDQGQPATIPETTDDPVTTHGGSGDLSIWLPEATETTEAKIAGETVRVFDQGDGASTIPLAKDDGSVQILTIIGEPGAPETYSYGIEADASASITINDDGSAVITDESGTFVGGVVAPWAIDSAGTTVPTRFEVQGDTLVQVVDHEGGDFAYPIVADPWLGQDLYYTPYITTVSQGYKVNVTPRSWGQQWAGVATWFAHRDEVVTKLGGNSWRWTNSIQEQFYCHIAGLPASLPQYNMESWRPTINWADSLARYRCNPYDGAWS